MTMPLQSFSSLESRYLDSCNKHNVVPNSAILSWLYKASLQKSNEQKCTMVISLEQLEDADISPLIEVFLNFQFDAISMICKSSTGLCQESILSLMEATSFKLNIVDLQHVLLTEDFLCNVFQGDLNCHMMKLRFTEAKTFKSMGIFALLKTLALDFCSSLTRMEKDFFAYMPNLMRLSLCGTRISDLWTTCDALSRLNCLVELRFQNYKYCKDTGPCPDLLEGMTDLHGIRMLDLTSDSGLVSSKMTNLLIKVSPSKLQLEEESKSPTSVLDCDQLSHSSVTADIYRVQHLSPICFEKHYREYMITRLTQLKVLDNIPVTEMDRKMAKRIFSMHFEHLPYKRQHNESITAVLHMRETGIMYNKKFSGGKHLTSGKRSQFYHSRSLCAAKYGSSICLVRLHLSHSRHTMKEGSNTLRSRQFEYHPSDSSLMAVGTLDGEVAVINHERGNIFRYFPSFSLTNRAIALCWLHKYPSKLLAGFDSGSLILYDINQVQPPMVEDIDLASCTMTYNKFEQLTSVHVNATDDKFLASSYSTKVSIYDICSGQCLQLLEDIHQEPINVAKFSWHSPNLLVTSSFDRNVKMWDLREKPTQPCYTTSSSRGNVMVCFSPDDQFLLVSAVDNEVKQLLAVDGRLHTEFGIVSTGSLHNYTRSYYMNGRDYIISGSSEESVVRICCSQTGRRLRSVYLENWDQGSSYLVHSLRSDPFRQFDMAILAASVRTSSPWEILKYMPEDDPVPRIPFFLGRLIRETLARSCQILHKHVYEKS